MLLTGLPLSASRAYELGFLQRIADTRAEVLEQAEALANTLAQNAPLAVQGMRSAFQRMAREGMSPELAREIEEKRRQSFASQDAAEGLRAFFEKRAPRFRGQ
jgi:enoyl-CoA hydratase/carnithine racemase